MPTVRILMHAIANDQYLTMSIKNRELNIVQLLEDQTATILQRSTDYQIQAMKQSLGLQTGEDSIEHLITSNRMLVRMIKTISTQTLRFPISLHRTIMRLSGDHNKRFEEIVSVHRTSGPQTDVLVYNFMIKFMYYSKNIFGAMRFLRLLVDCQSALSDSNQLLTLWHANEISTSSAHVPSYDSQKDDERPLL